MKAVIDSHGNELEIGKVYEFSDNQTSWNLYALKGCNGVADEDNYEYEANNCSWKFIRECQSPLGTIKKAPVNLVDGKAYQFESDGNINLGFYCETKKLFWVGDYAFVPNCCTDIIPLVPETK